MSMLKRPSSKRSALVIGAVLLIAAVLARGIFKKTAVDAYVLKPIDLNYTILANCTVDYPKPLDMSFLEGGIVRSVEARDGESIARGRTLVRLDAFEAERNLAISTDNLRSAELKLKNAREEVQPNLQERLNEYELNLEQAALTRKRYTELLAAGGIAKADLEKAEKEYQRALSQHNQQKLELENFSKSGLLADLANQVSIDKARVELAGRDLENTRIDAPFDGTVIKVHVQPGEKVVPATRAVTVVERAKWQLGLNVDQRELPFLKAGLPAMVTMDAYPDVRIAGEVSYVSPEVDKEKNTCEVRIELKDDRSFIKSGMAGRAEILAAKFDKALALPARFLKKGVGGAVVWLWNGRRAELIKTAFKPVGERWVLVEGLAEGSTVLDADVGASPGKLKPGREVQAEAGR